MYPPSLELEMLQCFGPAQIQMGQPGTWGKGASYIDVAAMQSNPQLLSKKTQQKTSQESKLVLAVKKQVHAIWGRSFFLYSIYCTEKEEEKEKQV